MQGLCLGLGAADRRRPGGEELNLYQIDTTRRQLSQLDRRGASPGSMTASPLCRNSGGDRPWAWVRPTGNDRGGEASNLYQMDTTRRVTTTHNWREWGSGGKFN